MVRTSDTEEAQQAPYGNRAESAIAVLIRNGIHRGPRIAIAILPVIAAASLCGDTVATVPVGGTANRAETSSYMLGWKFTASAPLPVTALAYLNPHRSGTGEAHEVGIFDAVSGNLLVSGIVPAGAATKSLNGFRVVPVSQTLPPGTYVIGGLRPSNADGAFLLCSSITTIPGVTFVEERELQTSSFTMPTNHADQAQIGVFGPSFVVASNVVAPAITGVSNSASNQPTFAPLTYITVYGTNLAGTTRPWRTSDFPGGNGLPLSLDGVSVTVDGTPAYVEYISGTQINIITPPAAVTGKGVPVVISIPGQPNINTWIATQPLAPSLFTWATGTADTGVYAVAQHVNFTNVGKINLFPTLAADFTTPATPGETIILYGTGFGPTNPPIAAGIVTDKLYPLNPLPTATLGGLPAKVVFAGLVPPLSQIYQFNITLPAGIGSGDWPLVLSVNGTLSYNALITIR